MSGTTVNLDDVCNYIINVATNHSTRTTHSQHSAAGQAQEQITFVLRRVVEELRARYAPTTRSVTQTPVPNQTYRNRATT